MEALSRYGFLKEDICRQQGAVCHLIHIYILLLGSLPDHISEMSNSTFVALCEVKLHYHIICWLISYFIITQRTGPGLGLSLKSGRAIVCEIIIQNIQYWFIELIIVLLSIIIIFVRNLPQVCFIEIILFECKFICSFISPTWFNPCDDNFAVGKLPLITGERCFIRSVLFKYFHWAVTFEHVFPTIGDRNSSISFLCGQIKHMTRQEFLLRQFVLWNSFWVMLSKTVSFTPKNVSISVFNIKLW